jgi:glucose-1-phosphate cytidylyltransferase
VPEYSVHLYQDQADERKAPVTQTVIFCGGKGTRISGGDPTVKKELVEIGNRPILWHVMKTFATYGFNEFCLLLGYRGDLIRRYFLEYDWMHRDLSFRLGERERPCYHGENPERDWQITLVDTGLEASKGERLCCAAQHIDGERFFLTYGDGLGDVDLSSLMRYHLAHGKLLTVTGYQPDYQYGVVQAGVDGCVTSYAQYPHLDHWINAGFMVLERRALEQLDPGMDLEKEFFACLVAQGEMRLYRHTSFWRSMDTFKEAQELNELWESNHAPWKAW